MRSDYLSVSVSDALAAERTVLAAERTLLAYVRSAFALLVAGITGIQLLDEAWLLGVASGLIVTSPLVLAIGVRRWRASRSVVHELLVRIADERAGS